MRNLFPRRFRAGRLITLVAVMTVGGLLTAVRPRLAKRARPSIVRPRAGWRQVHPRPPVLEVADPIEGFGALYLPLDQHLLTDGAFLSWFARQSPSTAIGGLYDLGGIFSTYSTAC